MIIEIPVLYRALIVRPGHRREEDCFLRTVVPLRLQEEDPALAITLTARSDAPDPFGDMVVPDRGWYLGSGGLMGNVLFRQNGTYHAMTVQQAIDQSQRRASPDPQHRGPMVLGMFQTGASLSRYWATDNHHELAKLPVYEEGIQTRSYLEAIPGGRDMAIAHATSTARRMSVRYSAEGRAELLFPSAGPVLMADCRPARVINHVLDERKMGHVFTPLEHDQAIGFHRRLHDPLPPIDLSGRVEVLIPEAVTWDSSAATLVLAAKQLIQHALGGQSVMPHASLVQNPQGGSVNSVSPLESDAFCDLCVASARALQGASPFSPSALQSGVARTVVEAARQELAEASCRFTLRDLTYPVRAGALGEMDAVLARSAHVPAVAPPALVSEEDDAPSPSP